MNSRKAILVALMGAALSLGCDKSKSSSTGSLSGEELVKAISKELAGSYCAAMKSCLPREELDVRFTRGALGTNCEEQWTRNLRGDMLVGLASSLADGQVKYIPSELSSCADKIKERSCGAFQESLFDVCTETFIRSAAKDGCRFDHECGTGSRCETEQSCPGKCVAKSQANQPCRLISDCAGGLTCSMKTATCQAMRSDGAKCEISSGADECGEGLYCVSGTCKRLEHLYTRSEGDSCDDAVRCKAGLSCAGPGRSRTCRTLKPKGETCFAGFPSHCEQGLFCDLAGNQAAGTCKQLASAGGKCSNPTECSPELSCVDGACQLSEMPGAACKSDKRCWSGSCVKGICAEQDPCADNELSAL